MSRVVICERTFARGPQRWRVNSSGQWSTMMWGWWPDSYGFPSYRFVSVARDKVPKEVLKAEKGGGDE